MSDSDKKYDHMTIALESGATLQTESASVELENWTGKERTGIATSSGDHAHSTKRVIPTIKGKAVFTNGQKMEDMDFVDQRITLRDTETGNRIICHKCCTEKVGALGKDNPDYTILVRGGIQEL